MWRECLKPAKKKVDLQDKNRAETKYFLLTYSIAKCSVSPYNEPKLLKPMNERFGSSWLLFVVDFTFGLNKGDFHYGKLEA